MAGTEIFGKEEIMAAADVIERKMIHRYGSHAERTGVYRAEEFEAAAREITGSKYALAVSSGTAALITALKGVGVKPGDEVITTPFTFIATIEAIVACDAVPVLGELDDTLSLDAASAEKLITPRTKAIMPVHMFGVAADMDKFVALGKKYNIPIIEDACEVVGGTYKGRALGGIGDCGAWSFDPNKTLTVGEAGMVFTDDHDTWFRMDCYHDHGHVHSKGPRPRRGGQIRLRRQLPHKRASGGARRRRAEENARGARIAARDEEKNSRSRNRRGPRAAPDARRGRRHRDARYIHAANGGGGA